MLIFLFHNSTKGSTSMVETNDIVTVDVMAITEEDEYKIREFMIKIFFRNNMEKHFTISMTFDNLSDYLKRLRGAINPDNVGKNKEEEESLKTP